MQTTSMKGQVPSVTMPFRGLFDGNLSGGFWRPR
jgi:hypothetical protein